MSLDLIQLQSIGKSLTASFVAWILAIFDDESLWPKDGIREQFIAGAQQACDYYHLTERVSKEVKIKEDPRSKEILAFTRPQVVKVYTDYEILLKEVKLTSDYFVFVDTPEEADYLLVFSQIKNFMSIPISQKVCQFPYESALIRKVYV